jgi:hypothetical protein
MQTKKWLGLAIASSLVGSGLMAVPTNAQQAPNQSDITGTNIWNNTAPIFRNDGKLSPEILGNADRLSEKLGDTGNRCCNAPPPTGPRRFARGPADPNEVCISPDCQQLNSMVEETKVFLGDVNRLQAEQQRTSRNRAW